MNKERLLKIAKKVNSYNGEDLGADLLHSLQRRYDKLSKSKEFRKDIFQRALEEIYWAVRDYYDGNTNYDFGKAYKIIEKYKKVIDDNSKLYLDNAKIIKGISDLVSKSFK